MKQNVWVLTLLIFILSSCMPSASFDPSSPDTSSSISESSLTSESSETTASSLSSSESSDSSSLTSSSSDTSSASASVSETSSIDAPVSLTEKWATLLNLTASLYREEVLPRTDLMVQTNVIEAVAIYEQDTNDVYGFAYEANVNGNGGLIRFRIAIVDDLFAAFLDVRHNEHGAFGVRIINVFKTQLVGQPATFEAAVNLLLASNLSRSGLSETYDGMLPAIEAMVIHATEVNI